MHAFIPWLGFEWRHFCERAPRESDFRCDISGSEREQARRAAAARSQDWRSGHGQHALCAVQPCGAMAVPTELSSATERRRTAVRVRGVACCMLLSGFLRKAWSRLP